MRLHENYSDLIDISLFKTVKMKLLLTNVGRCTSITKQNAMQYCKFLKCNKENPLCIYKSTVTVQSMASLREIISMHVNISNL